MGDGSAWGRGGTSAGAASLRFLVVKLWDYNARWAELEASANPFATVVMVHLQTRATHGDPESRLRWKTRLVRGLYHRGWGWREVVDLFRFIDWMMALPEELALQFESEHVRFEKELKMRYVTTVERFGRERGFKEGLEVGTEQGLRQGTEQGLQRGIEQGISRGETLLLERLLSRRFSALPSWVQERLRGASREELESWSDRVLDAGSLEEVFAH